VILTVDFCKPRTVLLIMRKGLRSFHLAFVVAAHSRLFGPVSDACCTFRGSVLLASVIPSLLRMLFWPTQLTEQIKAKIKALARGSKQHPIERPYHLTFPALGPMYDPGLEVLFSLPQNKTKQPSLVEYVTRNHSHHHKHKQHR
jgi:hypothetical protein